MLNIPKSTCYGKPKLVTCLATCTMTKLLNRELHAFSQSSSLISLSLYLFLDILGDSALWLAEDANLEYPWLTWRLKRVRKSVVKLYIASQYNLWVKLHDHSPVNISLVVQWFSSKTNRPLWVSEITKKQCYSCNILFLIYLLLVSLLPYLKGMC